MERLQSYISLTDKGLYFTVVLCRFGNPNPLGSAREGHAGGRVQQALSNGFTKGTQVHRFGANVDTARILRHTHPYVARSVTLDFVRAIYLHSTVLSPPPPPPPPTLQEHHEEKPLL